MQELIIDERQKYSHKKFLGFHLRILLIITFTTNEKFLFQPIFQLVLFPRCLPQTVFSVLGAD